MKNIAIWLSCAFLGLTIGYVARGLYYANEGLSAYDLVHLSAEQKLNKSIRDNANNKLSNSALNDANTAKNNTTAHHPTLHNLSSIDIARMFESIDGQIDIYQTAKLYATIYTASYLTLQRVFDQLLVIQPESFYMMGQAISQRMFDLQAQSTLTFLASYHNNRYALSLMRKHLYKYSTMQPIEAAFWMIAQDYVTLFRGQGDIARHIFQNMAKLDLSLATDLVSQLHPRLKQSAITGIASLFEYSSDFSTLISYLNLNQQPQLLDSLLNEWAQKSPQEVAYLLDTSYVGESFPKARLNTLFNWQLDDFAQASNWFLRSEKDFDERKKVSYILRGARKDQDPNEVLAWIKSTALSAKDDAFREFFNNITHTQTDFVIDNLNIVKNIKYRETIAIAIYKALLRNNEPNLAERFLEGSEFTQQLRLQASQEQGLNKVRP